MHLAAAGLGRAEVDLMTEPLEEPHRRDAALRSKCVGETGDEERDAHGRSIIAAVADREAACSLSMIGRWLACGKA